VADLGWVEPGVTTAIDVAGIVAADGTVTFVLLGSPDAEVAVSSKEGAAPPRLVLTVASSEAAAA
jgi:hypothetical protein